MKKVAAVSALIFGVLLSFVSSYLMAIMVGFGDRMLLPFFILGLVLVSVGYRFSHPLLRSRWARRTVTALRLMVAVPMLLSCGLFLYGYVKIGLIEHHPIVGAIESAIGYALAIPMLFWPELRWLSQKLGLAHRPA